MTLSIRRKEGKIFSHVRQKWLVETPEEGVRQEYLGVLLNEYGFAIEQIGEELEVTGRGSGQARADFVIWRTAQDKADQKAPFIIVECKADNVTISGRDYSQGENYARLTDAPFFVTHNRRETKFWRVRKDRMPGYIEEIQNIPHADASDKEIKELIEKLKVFKEDEFADLLHKCHNIIRNREHLDPAAAFDEIAKILFVKTGVERRLKSGKQRKNLFTADFLDEQKVVHDDPMNVLFDQTKREFKADRIFTNDDRIALKFNTSRAIVEELEKYNLSDTSEDIKGIAFERFLGRTFRGEIGQFFTPRPIVEFMIQMMEPKEGDIVCDPASGSGGFLIRFFELVRQQIYADADREYQEFKAAIDAGEQTPEEKADALRKKYALIQVELDQHIKDTRLWKLANRCIYGTDANERMARTSKMNMIMHGDGHGGVHHQNGFINVNGIFEGRFDIILTNPPFGANVEGTDHVEEAQVTVPEEIAEQYRKAYGSAYDQAQARVQAAKGKPIASLFKLPKAETSKIKTEILFIERCLDLLKPGGRLGIVLPEGIFNNPSLTYVREFVEDRAFVRAVLSLPQETFMSSGASVKASLLFLQKFNTQEKADFDAKQQAALAEVEAQYADEKAALKAIADKPRHKLSDFSSDKKLPPDEKKRLQAQVDAANAQLKAEKAEAAAKLKELQTRIAQQARALLKQRFNYPVFLYEAEKVGISATGEVDANELYPNERLPAGIDKTAVELFREFRKDPTPFFV
ncbi:N-6 DNA methylase [Methylomicrobium sp. Wu6]|uniref:N-6 DNA methylase n=1 Tax=Methylomicrobium sp. Wu6 TaxID=3107928 RepID=UPI002DD63565|nr:N-6 DNA methylase [Methylomicrobium sp. Wu6]MEC4747226.1 N-6 DNA methylase [Methylomicrobium sp. Wu6]